MNKKFQLIIFFIIFFIIVLGFKNYVLIKEVTLDMSKLFVSNVLPFLLFMMVLNKLLIYFNFPKYINELFKNDYVYLFIMSLLSGAPINAIIIKEYLNNKNINSKTASLLLMFTNFNNPLFLFNYFKLIFSNNYISLKLFIIIYIINFIGYVYIIKHLPNFEKHEDVSSNIGSIFSQTSQTILSIFVTLIFFKIISNLIIPGKSFFCLLSKGLIEITGGLDSLLYSNIDFKIKELLTVIILLFNGFSIHIQISSILTGYDVNYKYFYLSKIALIILGVILTIIF